MWTRWRGQCALSPLLKVYGSRDMHKTRMTHFQGETQERAEPQHFKNVGVLVLSGEELEGKRCDGVTVMSYRIRAVSQHRSFMGIPEVIYGNLYG